MCGLLGEVFFFFFFFLFVLSRYRFFFFSYLTGLTPPHARTYTQTKNLANWFGQNVLVACWLVLVAFVGIVGQLLRVLIIHTFSRERVKERGLGSGGKARIGLQLRSPRFVCQTTLGLGTAPGLFNWLVICLAIHMHCISLFSFSLP